MGRKRSVFEPPIFRYLRSKGYAQRRELRKFMERMAQQKYQTWCVYTIIDGGDSDSENQSA